MVKTFHKLKKTVLALDIKKFILKALLVGFGFLAFIKPVYLDLADFWIIFAFDRFSIFPPSLIALPIPSAF